MITCFDPTGASPPSIGGLLLCPRLGAVGIGGRAGEDTGPYGGRFTGDFRGTDTARRGRRALRGWGIGRGS